MVKKKKKKPNLNYQPISKLPTFAWSIDGWVKNLEEQYQTLIPAKLKPHVLDDHTISRVFEVIGKQKDDVWMWEDQLKQWQKTKLNEPQREEVRRLSDQINRVKELINTILTLADELKESTIEKVLAKDDIELAMEFLMGKRKF